MDEMRYDPKGDLDNLGIVIGVCPFGCGGEDADDGQVEFAENLFFEATLDSVRVEILRVELRYTCHNCWTSFSIEDDCPLEIVEVKELQERLKIETSKIDKAGIMNGETLALIVDSRTDAAELWNEDLRTLLEDDKE